MNCSHCIHFSETSVPSLGLCKSHLDSGKNCSLVDSELRACPLFVAIQEKMAQVKSYQAA